MVDSEKLPLSPILPGLKQIGLSLHDLCQPLTALQCRLEMAEMMDTENDYREATAVALKECERLNDCVTRMRQVLRSMLPAGAEDVLQ